MIRALRRYLGLATWEDLTTAERQMVAALLWANKLTRLG